MVFSIDDTFDLGAIFAFDAQGQSEIIYNAHTDLSIA